MVEKEHKIILPDLSDIKKGIDELLLIDKWNRYKIKTSPKRFEKRLDNLFLSKIKTLLYPLILADQKSFNFKLYRVRKQTKTMNENLISEFSYPPNEVNKYHQRANIPFHPVLYCSDTPATAIFEAIRDNKKHKSTDSYYLSQWRFKKNVKITISPFLFQNISEECVFHFLSVRTSNQIKELLKDYSKDEVENFFKISNLLSHLFIYDNTYVVSSYIAHKQIYAPHNYRADVFIYPSIKTNKRSVNFAIHPNAVIEKLELESIYKLRVPEINIEEGSTRSSISHVGENKNGIIYWNKVDKNSKNGKRIIEKLDNLFKQE